MDRDADVFFGGGQTETKVLGSTVVRSFVDLGGLEQSFFLSVSFLTTTIASYTSLFVYLSVAIPLRQGLLARTKKKLGSAYNEVLVFFFSRSDWLCPVYMAFSHCIFRFLSFSPLWYGTRPCQYLFLFLLSFFGLSGR